MSDIPKSKEKPGIHGGDGSQFFADINQDRSDVKLITDKDDQIGPGLSLKKRLDDDSVIQVDKTS